MLSQVVPELSSISGGVLCVVAARSWGGCRMRFTSGPTLRVAPAAASPAAMTGCLRSAAAVAAAAAAADDAPSPPAAAPTRRGDVLPRLPPAAVLTPDKDLASLGDHVWRGVVQARYYDVAPAVRVATAAALGRWAAAYPAVYLSDERLKYFGWLLNDPASAVRGAAVGELIGLYREPGLAGSLDLFASRLAAASSRWGATWTRGWLRRRCGWRRCSAGGASGPAPAGGGGLCRRRRRRRRGGGRGRPPRGVCVPHRRVGGAARRAPRGGRVHRRRV